MRSERRVPCLPMRSTVSETLSRGHSGLRQEHFHDGDFVEREGQRHVLAENFLAEYPYSLSAAEFHTTTEPSSWKQTMASGASLTRDRTRYSSDS